MPVIACYGTACKYVVFTRVKFTIRAEDEECNHTLQNNHLQAVPYTSLRAEEM